jgi:hypothetical protein
MPLLDAGTRQQVLDLPDEERAALTESLLATFELRPATSSLSLDGDWDTEFQNRIESLLSGKTTTITGAAAKSQRDNARRLAALA